MQALVKSFDASTGTGFVTETGSPYRDIPFYAYPVNAPALEVGQLVSFDEAPRAVNTMACKVEREVRIG